MSTTSITPTTRSAELTEFPDFDLEYLFDDQDDPTEVTIFSPGNDDITTHWLTIDVDSAVSIEAMR